MEELVLNRALLSISPQKLHTMVRFLRKKKLIEALKLLALDKKKPALLLAKVFRGLLNSLIKQGENGDDFFLSHLVVGMAPNMQKKVIFRAKGDSSPLRRRRSLLYCTVTKLVSLQKADVNKSSIK